MRLPIGLSDFAELRRGNYVYVDKSLFIKDIIDDGAKIILYTRPRRFGKTINMSMLYHYFLKGHPESVDYFKKLAIWQQGEQYREEQGKYPVIFLSLKAAKFQDFTATVDQIATIMQAVFEKHNDLLNQDALSAYSKKVFEQLLNKTASLADLRNSLKFLTKALYEAHHIKPILIIDEYDSPIHASFIHGYYEEMISFMQHFLGESLKDNSNLHKGIITGILRVAKESVFSGLNNLKVYTTLSQRYREYFGFLPAEVEQLLQQARADEKILEQAKDWYNGYHFHQQVIYNPWSILNMIDEGFSFQPYWVNTSDNLLIDNLIKSTSSNAQRTVEKLMQQQPVNVEIEEDIVFADLKLRENALWNFLLHTGYLTMTNKTQDLSGFFHADFLIPNKEVALLYKTLIKRWFGTAQTPSSNKITQALLSQDIDQFKNLLGKFLSESFSYFDTQGRTREQIYHVFVLGLVAHLSDYYLIHSNREAGDGRYDVVMIPKDKTRTGIIFEFKVLAQGTDPAALEKAANAALTQIQDKDYLTEFQQAGIEDILQLGIAFSGKSFELVSA